MFSGRKYPKSVLSGIKGTTIPDRIKASTASEIAAISRAPVGIFGS